MPTDRVVRIEVILEKIIIERPSPKRLMIFSGWSLKIIEEIMWPEGIKKKVKNIKIRDVSIVSSTALVINMIFILSS